jgi:hypothetical protein
MMIEGSIRKMQVRLAQTVEYSLPVGDQIIAMNALIGKPIALEYGGSITCINCGRRSKKSFSQGYCFPCFKSLAECDMCIMRPETCHFHLGTCRDDAWAESHCMQDHYVYIANSSGLKVGITRGTQLPTRWIDQGALQAVAMFRVRNRYFSGLLEATIKKFVSDRTDWRKMLKGGERLVDFREMANGIVEQARSDVENLRAADGVLEWEVLDEPVTEIHYPVQHYPEKVSSLNFDKTPRVSGILHGIKGQYLILDSGVINIRKFSGYEVALTC